MPFDIPNIQTDLQCHHIQAPTGQRCGSPSMKGEYYCFHHKLRQNKRASERVLIDPEITRLDFPDLEDRPSILVALAAVVHRLGENTIDTKRSGQMIYALQVMLRAFPPDPAPAPATHKCRHPERSRAAAESKDPETAHAASIDGTLSTTNQDECPSKPAPKTINITKQSLLYFLRSRHCYRCNAELFPANELVERRHPGARLEVIEETPRQPGEPPQLYEDIRRGLNALRPAKLPASTSTEQQPTDNATAAQPATVLPALQAVAENRPLSDSRLRTNAPHLRIEIWGTQDSETELVKGWLGEAEAAAC